MTRKEFQKAHLALCEMKRKEAEQHAKRKRVSKRDIVEAFAIALGIFIALYGLCAFASDTNANGWQVGDYRTTPCWND